MGISINGPSGIDTQYIIDSLVGLEKNKVTAVQQEKKAYQVKIDAYSKLQSLLSDIRSKALALSKTSSFDLFTTSSSNEKAVTIKGGTGSVDAQYDIRVFQLASTEKMISGDNRISDQNATLSSLGVGAGDISIGGVQITISDEDTLQDLRMKINNATDASGNKLGVSASVLKVSDTNFRLVLSAKESGSGGVEYKDITGSTLQDLGIITTADGEKGNVSQTVSSSGDVLSAFNGLAPGETIQISGTDHDGRTVTGTFLKRTGSTSDDFLKSLSDTFHGMADVSFDGSGNLVMTDKVTGSSQLGISSLLVGGTAIEMSTTVFGEEGSGVLSAGKDAYFSVEGLHMSSSTNSASGFVTGATFELHEVSADKAVTVSLKRDMEGIQKKFQELVDNFNALVRFSKDNTKYADPNNENSKKGILAGDATVSTIVSQVRSFFQQRFDKFGGTYTNFTMIGLKTNTQNGEFTIDDDMFKKAMDTGFEEVMRLFITVGVSSDPGISMGRNTADTSSGRYTLEEIDSEHFRIQLEGSTDWYTSDPRTGDIITFSDGPAKGLSLTAPSGSIGIGGSATFTFSKGLATILDESITSLTDSRDGLVALRQESWRKSMKSADQRILKLEDRIDRYRLRLVKQFSDMEQAMSQLQSQSANMLSALGTYSR